jgi:hypothetical protein
MLTVTRDLVLPTAITGSYPRPLWYDASLHGRSFKSALGDSMFREQYLDAVACVINAQESAGPGARGRPPAVVRKLTGVLEPDLPIVDTHRHLWERGGHRYLLHEFLADVDTSHNVVATVFVECEAMYRGGPSAAEKLALFSGTARRAYHLE